MLPADWVLKNGAIYTVDASRTWTQALAVSGRRIAYVGADGGVEPFVGAKTRVIDLQGRMVLPGFFDSHAHPPAALDMVLSVNLYPLASLEAYRERVVEFAAKNPTRPVVRGAGWTNALFPLTGPGKRLLDELVSDRPVCLCSEDGHSYWVNSKALEMAGITRDMPNPEGGVIERDPATGEPHGTLRENAMELVDAVLPPYTTDDRVQGLLAYQKMAGEWGITTVLDAMVSEAIDAYETLEAAGRFTLRYRGALLVDPKHGPEQVEQLLHERVKHTGPLFQTASAKIFVDGVVEGETAYLCEPYTHRPGYRGELLWEPQNLNQVCAALDRAGFQLHAHAIGDAAVRVALDAYEYACCTNGRRDSRHLITHLQLVAPQDIRRFAELDVVGVPQPFWFGIDDYYWNLQLPYLGQERADAEYPMQSFIEAGVIMASGSDFPVTVPAKPLHGIHSGVTRTHVGRNADPGAVLKEGEWGVLWPTERASLADMIASFTIHGAYAHFLETQTGSLEVGKLADLVVLDRNLFEMPAPEIGEAVVLLTMFEGQQVYRDPRF
jgi:hypothetical protein